MIKTICVCGAGTMGSGIAQVAAQAGFTTILFDVSQPMLAKGKTAIETNLEYLLNKQKITAAEKEQISNRVSFTNKYGDCIADVIIEAIIEDADAKAAVLNQLASLNDREIILATNTSSLSITGIQEKTDTPQQLAGMHFFNPAPQMQLVEIIKGAHTSNAVTATLHELCVKFGKTPVHCIDSPGFIVNRIARPYYLEAMQLLSEGVASVATIDRIMEATGFKMGPFKLMDLIGLDINYNVSRIVWEALGKPERLQPSPIQEEKVKAGMLGKKTGKGFYKY